MAWRECIPFCQNGGPFGLVTLVADGGLEMKLRTAFLVLAVCCLGLLGCGLFGGGEEAAGGDGEEFEMMEFEDSGDSAPPPVEELFLKLSLNPEVLVEIRYLYRHQVVLEEMKRLNRDLQSLLEYSGEGDVNLEWVIEVHEVTGVADGLFERVIGERPPDALWEQYEYLFVNLLDAIQVTGYGADRVLAASIKVGPSGRTLMTMPADELAEFETLVREARFYLRDGGRLIDKEISELEGLIGGLRLR